jgi:purine-binding chemotaxis protein CheW
VIIVVRIGEQLQGIVVDAVSDIVTLDPSLIQPVPDVGEASAAAFLEGIATTDERLIMILGLDRLSESGTPLAEAA